MCNQDVLKSCFLPGRTLQCGRTGRYVMKLKIGLVVLVLTMTAGAAMANPIPDNVWANFQVGWFWNTPPVGPPQACSVVCNGLGGLAEMEQYSPLPPAPQNTFACKFQTGAGGPAGPQWVYGNNFIPAAPLSCQSVDATGALVSAAQFFCLCAQ